MGCVSTKSNISSVKYTPSQLVQEENGAQLVQGENGALGELPEIDDPMKKYRQLELRYENLILEGGGTKTYAYLGALKVKSLCIRECDRGVHGIRTHSFASKLPFQVSPI